MEFKQSKNEYLRDKNYEIEKNKNKYKSIKS